MNGTVEEGKLADLLLLDADPLADIRNICRLHLLMKEGRVVALDTLPERPIYERPAARWGLGRGLWPRRLTVPAPRG